MQSWTLYVPAVQGPVPVMPAGLVASSGVNLPGSASAPGSQNPPGTGSGTAVFSSLLIPGMPRSPAMPNGGTQSYSMYTGLYGSQAQQQQQQAPAMLGVRHPATLPGQVPAQSAGWGSSGLQMPFASSSAGASSAPMSFASLAAAPLQVILWLSCPEPEACRSLYAGQACLALQLNRLHASCMCIQSFANRTVLGLPCSLWYLVTHCTA